MSIRPVVLAVVSALVASRGAAQRPTTMAHRSTVYAPHGAIATSQPLATTAGLDVLQRGGNAIDAAVTAAAVLNVVEPMMTGIGGDLFALIWVAKEHRLVALNASGRAGALMTLDALLAKGHRAMPEETVEDVTVPGALLGWDELLKRYGTITLAQALGPAIGYAEDGFPVTPIIARDWANEAGRLRQDSGARATFLIDGSRAPRAGEWFRNADLARTFRQIATQGPTTLYGGELGQRIVARVRALGGYLTSEDLQRHQNEWMAPISVPFHGYRVWELPPNNQGLAVLEMLRMLEPYDLRALGHNSAAYLHRLTVAPGKRPFHTLIPGFVTRPDSAGTEQPWLSFGVMGGSMQPQGHVQVLLNLLVFGMDLQDAIDAPRFRHLTGLRVALEPAIGGDVRRRLAAMGHVIVPDSTVTFGGAQAIQRLAGGRGYAAGSDPRKDGMAAGH